jgi:hypothetical protein
VDRLFVGGQTVSAAPMCGGVRSESGCVRGADGYDRDYGRWSVWLMRRDSPSEGGSGQLCWSLTSTPKSFRARAIFGGGSPRPGRDGVPGGVVFEEEFD